MNILKYPLVLASQSPRRKELLTQLGYDFTIQVKPTLEQFSESMNHYEVPAFLAMQKAQEFTEEQKQHLILCADTVVLLDGKILNKPQDEKEAYRMISQLSGKEHEVISAVCLASPEGIETITDVAKVTFRELTDSEIEHYIQHYQPFDKAGAYGIQEWIGMIGITKMEGSFYTIMGLPTHLVYQLLKPYHI